jgi:hypothetical protein
MKILLMMMKINMNKTWYSIYSVIWKRVFTQSWVNNAMHERNDLVLCLPRAFFFFKNIYIHIKKGSIYKRRLVMLVDHPQCWMFYCIRQWKHSRDVEQHAREKMCDSLSVLHKIHTFDCETSFHFFYHAWFSTAFWQKTYRKI